MTSSTIEEIRQPLHQNREWKQHRQTDIFTWINMNIMSKQAEAAEEQAKALKYEN